MEHNLKNHPIRIQGGFNPSYQEHTAWFEGFEKELREKLEFEENQAKKPDREQSIIAHFQIDLIKEILGA